MGGALRRARRVRRARGCCTSRRSRSSSRSGSGCRSTSWYWAGVVVGRGPARLRALARPPGRPAAARRGVLHDERRDQRRVLRVRARRRALEPRRYRSRAVISRARKLSKRFGDKRVLDKVDVEPRRAASFLLVTGPNGSGKTTLLRVLAGLDAPTAGELALPDRGAIGYLGHEPLVYRELTPLENLHLFGRLYRVPERGERIGMLLERFGLWEVRDERVSTFSRGMRQRLGLCRVAAPRARAASSSTSRSTRSTRPASALLDATLDELAPRSARRRRDPRPGARRAARDRAAGVRMRYFSRRRRARAQGPAARAAGEGDGAGDAALRPLGADDLPLRAARRARADQVGARPALDGDRLHGAPRPDARVRPRARAGLFDALVLAPCDRSAIWLGEGALGASRSSRSPRSSRCRRSRLFFFGVGWRTVAAVALADIGICAVGTLTGAMAVAGRARELILPLLFLPLAIPIVVGGVGASVVAGRQVPRVPRALRRRLRPALAGRAFEYVVAET